MEVQITIEMEKVMSEVSKHFALIGKRLKDKKGDTMFAKTTLSSSEEKGIMKQYINAAAETFVAELAPQVTYYKNGDAMVIKFENSRWADGEDSITVPFEGNFMGYVIAYVSNAVLGMTEAELAPQVCCGHGEPYSGGHQADLSQDSTGKQQQESGRHDRRNNH